MFIITNKISKLPNGMAYRLLRIVESPGAFVTTYMIYRIRVNDMNNINEDTK